MSLVFSYPLGTAESLPLDVRKRRIPGLLVTLMDFIAVAPD